MCFSPQPCAIFDLSSRQMAPHFQNFVLSLAISWKMSCTAASFSQLQPAMFEGSLARKLGFAVSKGCVEQNAFLGDSRCAQSKNLQDKTCLGLGRWHEDPHETSFVQSNRNRKRRERHQARMQRKQETNRHMKRRMIWNRMQREERIARDQAADQKQLPHIQVPAQPGYVRIGNINLEKSNPEKLEQLVCLAAHRGWEVTLVSECCPTARGARPQVNCRHWKWEGWELIHTGSVGILLNPDWSHAWHTHRAPKDRSPTGRVLSIVLPRDPLSDAGQRPPSWIVTAVWAPVSTSSVDELDTFWDEIACATRRECQFRPDSRLTATLHEHTPHVLGGDFNAQVFEDVHEADASPLMGRYRPPCRHQLDEYAFDKISSLDD